MTRAVLSLGSNLGDRLAHLQSAVDGLGSAVRAVSPVFQTEPWGPVAQDDYLNAIALVDDAAADPDEWLRRAQQLEQRAGRTRTVRFGPRTLDVDVITVDGVCSDDPRLTLPHPRAHERAFVLVPWLAVAPDARLPRRAPSGPPGAAADRLPDPVAGGAPERAYDGGSLPHGGGAPEPLSDGGSLPHGGGRPKTASGGGPEPASDGCADPASGGCADPASGGFAEPASGGCADPASGGLAEAASGGRPGPDGASGSKPEAASSKPADGGGPGPDAGGFGPEGDGGSQPDAGGFAAGGGGSTPGNAGLIDRAAPLVADLVAALAPDARAGVRRRDDLTLSWPNAPAVVPQPGLTP